MARGFYCLMIRRGGQKNYYAQGICTLHLPILEWDEFQIFKTIGSMRETKYFTHAFLKFQKIWKAHRRYRLYVTRNLRNREITGYQRRFLLSEWLQ